MKDNSEEIIYGKKEPFIYINGPVLEEKIALLKEKRRDLYDLFGVIEEDVNYLPNIWGGDNGTSSYEKLTSYTPKFARIIKRIDNNILFLEQVLESYNSFETLVKDKTDEIFK